MYVFETQVKYIDKNGVVQYKSNEIVPSSKSRTIFSKYAYENESNNIKTYFSNNVNDGIAVESSDVNLTMTPVSKTDSKISLEKEPLSQDTMVEYKSVFDDTIKLQYMPTFGGIKENIILTEYTGINTFKFDISVGDYVPAFLSGESIPFLNPETNEIVFFIGQVDARDSYNGERTDGHFTIYNNLDIESNGKGKYRLTVTVDKDFLENDNTVYPVVIDPQFTIYNGNMQDTTVYASKPDTQSFYTSAYNVVGNHGSGYGEGMAFVKIDNMQSFKYINPQRITSAYYHVREASGKTNSMYVQVHDTYTTWEQNTITWNNKSTYHYNNYGLTVSSSTWYDFTITGLVKEWLSYELNEGGWTQNYGFALKAADASASSKHFCSANYSGSLTPSIVVNYTEDTSLANGVYHIKNVWTGKYLDVADPAANQGYSLINVIAFSLNGNGNQQWKVVSQGNGWYKLYSMWPFSSLKCLDVTGDNVDVYNDDSGDYLLFRIIKNADGSYRLMNKYGGNTTNALDLNGNSSSPDYQKNVISYEYSGSSNQKWTFSNVNFGSGGSYRSVGAVLPPDCMGYSLTMANSSAGQKNVGLYILNDSNYTVDHTTGIERTLAQYVNYRRLENFSSAIQSNEYRIAIRVPNGINGWNFHVIYQLSNGT